MPPRRVKICEKQRKFKGEWAKKYPWVTKAPDGSENAYFCKDNLVAKLSNLGTHENSKKHKQRIEKTSKGLCRNITSMFKLLCFFKRFVMGTNNKFIFYFSTLKVQFSIHSSLLSGMRLQ